MMHIRERVLQPTIAAGQGITRIELSESPIITTDHPELQLGESLKLLLPEKDIDERVTEMALAIKRDYGPLLPNVVFVPIETGGGRFLRLLQKKNSGHYYWRKNRTYEN